MTGLSLYNISRLHKTHHFSYLSMVGTTALGMLAVAASTARVVSALDPDICGSAGDGAVSKTLLLVLSSGGQANQRFQQTTSHGRHAHLAKPCGFSGQRKQGGQAAPGMEMKGFVCGRPEEYHQETLLANEIGVKN